MAELVIDSTPAASPPASPAARRPGGWLSMLWCDKVAFAAAVFLLLVLLAVVFGQGFAGVEAGAVNLQARNAPPFSIGQGWLFALGADALGRPILARIIVGANNTVVISFAAVVLSMVVGLVLGLVAGWRDNGLSDLIMRSADVVMSFPSMLLALIVLYVLQPSVLNIVIVLAITRVPIYVRTTRAQVLEARERVFVTAARVMGAGPVHIVMRHILPTILPTVVTVATLQFAVVMLAESTLSFLGLGIQPPEFTWGLMVAQGQGYLRTAWWLAFWPGVAITLTATAMNIIANWLRIATDPVQRWRLEARRTRP